MRIWPSGYRYDVFLSHAAADGVVADVLYRSLTRLGLKVWYAKYEIPPNGGLKGAIPDAMGECRFAIALVSKVYLQEYWTMREYTVFNAREAQGVKTLFTVLYGVTPEALQSKSGIPDRHVLSYENNPDEIARRILYESRYMGSGSVGEWILENSYALRIWSAVAASVVIGLFGYLYYHDQQIPETMARPAQVMRTKPQPKPVKKLKQSKSYSQCTAFTKAGARCKRAAVSHGKCKRHQ